MLRDVLTILRDHGRRILRRTYQPPRWTSASKPHRPCVEHSPRSARTGSSRGRPLRHAIWQSCGPN